MATIIRAADAHACPRIAAFHFDDVAAQADRRLAQGRIDAAHLVAQAEGEADLIRRHAAEEGCRAAMRDVERMVEERVAPSLEALGRTADELKHAKQAWLAHWEEAAVRLAAAMAARIVRRELRQRPEITLTLVREALELAAGSPDVRLHLNPQDYQTLGEEVRKLTKTMSALGQAEVTADESIGPGGCRVETRFGTIDQRIESQLNRIVEELLG